MVYILSSEEEDAETYATAHSRLSWLLCYRAQTPTTVLYYVKMCGWRQMVCSCRHSVCICLQLFGRECWQKDASIHMRISVPPKVVP